MADAPQIRKRPDGFYEVSGVAGYHTKENAVRVARQMQQAHEAAEADPDSRPKVTGEVFEDGMTVEEAETEEKPAPTRTRRSPAPEGSQQ